MATEQWIHRLWIFGAEADGAALNQIAVDACAAVFPGEPPEAQRQTFRPVAPGAIGADVAATETLRQALDALLGAALMGGKVAGPVLIARLANGTDRVEASYGVNPEGAFGPGPDRGWTWAEAVAEAAGLIGQG